MLARARICGYVLTSPGIAGRPSAPNNAAKGPRCPLGWYPVARLDRLVWGSVRLLMAAIEVLDRLRTFFLSDKAADDD
jgi:hypothetical protein